MDSADVIADPIIGGLQGPYDTQSPDLDKTYTNLQAGKYNDAIKGYEIPKPLSDLANNIQGASTELQALDQIFSWHESKAFISKCKECNVYTDVAPFVETAVINTDEQNQALSRAEMIQQIQVGQYINACYIKSAFKEVHPSPEAGVEQPFGLIIATQGPKENTIEDFWSMVVQ